MIASKIEKKKTPALQIGIRLGQFSLLELALSIIRQDFIKKLWLIATI